jgi:rfaE bifunctional protein kinase chain/domain
MAQILVIGDLMLDKYISGSCHRISPEAPVPVLSVNEESCTLGGAANVAANLTGLGLTTDIFGRIGDDADGVILLRKLAENQINLIDSERYGITTTKTRFISMNQQMIRVDREIHTRASSQEIDALTKAIETGAYKYIIISDYNKGICTAELTELVISLANQRDIPVFVDPKSRDWTKYHNAFLIKPNLKELDEIIPLDGQKDNSIIYQNAKLLLEQLKLKYILLTKGSDGMVLMNSDGYQHFKAKKVEVYDVSGAGDTTLAVLVAMLCEGRDINESVRISNLSGSYVVTKSRTHAISKEELSSLIQE